MTDEPVKKINPVRAVTPEAVKLAKTLIHSAKFGALAVTDTMTGRPGISRVAVATDTTGAPITLVSSLSAHTKALAHNPYCAILLGEPAKGDPLAHPRISLSCYAAFLDRDTPETDQIAARYLRCNPKSKLYASFADFHYVRLTPISASLNAGFGRAYNLDTAHVLSPPFSQDGNLDDQEIMRRLNGPQNETVAAMASIETGKTVLKCVVLNFDSEGLDLLLGGHFRRIWFAAPLATKGDLFAFMMKYGKMV